MAHWNYKNGKTHYYPAKDMGNGWYRIDCGCSSGLQWGGEYPRKCDRCGGDGCIAWHKKSKVFAHYPGGPFQGKRELTERELNGGEF